MALTPEAGAFISRWLSKASAIEPKELADYFDKFITLFVAYNRLYAEATFLLWRKNTVKPPDANRNFPDGKAAKVYVVTFLGERELAKGLESDDVTNAAIEEMREVIRGKRFGVLLQGPYSQRDRPSDEALLSRLESNKSATRCRAVLEFVYSVRCNTLHGSKGFESVQIEVLKPCITVVERLISLLLAKLA